MNKYRVVYETINGQTKGIEVMAKDAKDAESKVYNNYADCLQVINVS